MLRAVIAILFALLVAIAPSAQADPDPLPSNPLADPDEEEPQPTAGEDALAKTQADVLDAKAKEPGILEGLLDDTLGMVGDAGSALVGGVGSAFAAIGTGITALFAALGSAAVWTWNGLMAGGRGLGTGLLWSVTGVGTLMGDAIVGTGRAIGDTFIAIGDGLHMAAAAFAQLRPDSVPPSAWAGVAAASTASAAAGGNIGLYTLLRKLGWAAPGIGMFTRISKEDILEHPLRNEIHDAIKTNPGIHVSALSRLVDAGWGTTVHHLKKLQDKELIAVRNVNNQKCYFLNGGGIGRDRWVQMSELKNETAGRIAQFILAHPFQTLTGISETLRLSPSLVSHHVSKLVKAGVLEKVRDGRFVKIAVTQDAREGLFGERPMDAPVPDIGNAVAA
ncbi:MAG: ArsR family transcriptional regulator [Euryarchaeota archaeon]|nr:ArsR family transcriptional regulator [Euryarchaeota archaeon]